MLSSRKFSDIKDCAEIQKPYPDDEGARVREKTDVRGGEAGCRRLYLETHTNLASAILSYKIKIQVKEAGEIAASNETPG